MATLAPQFNQALRNVEPQRIVAGDDADNARLAHAEVREVLQADTKLCEGWGVKPKLIGSYARDVSIRRVKDVDVFCRLTSAPEALMPGEAMTEFERVLEAQYGQRCERQHRSFKVDFPDFDLSVDVVPAKPCGEHWQLPSRDPGGVRGSWVETNPLELNRLTSQMNAAFPLGRSERGMYVPTVKLVRQVRRHVLGDQPGGLFLELMTYEVFSTQMTVQDTVAAYLSETLGCLATCFDKVIADGLPDPTMPGRSISTRATNADLKAARSAFTSVAALAREALETDEQCAAAKLWQQVLGSNDDGEVFELPSYCSVGTASADRASVPGRKPGADRVPAGKETYA